MSDNVVFLTGQPLPAPDTPNASLVCALEELLSQARTGQLQTFMGVGVMTGNNVVKCFSHAAHRDYFVHLGP